MRQRSVIASVVVALATILGACTTTSAVVITVTSHTDGQRVIGSRTVTLAGTLSGGTVTAFAITLDGAPVAGATHTDTSFSATLDLADDANAVVVSATSAAGTATKSLTLVYPHLALATFQSGSVVIGQPNFVVSGGSLTQAGLDDVYGRPAVVGSLFYVPDYKNNRVLGFASGVPSSNGANADFVLGQPDFVTATAGATADAMDGPQTVVAAGGHLYVDEYGNNRVLIYDTPPTSTHASADHVLGQAGFGTALAACSASGLDSPESIFAVGTKLLVADSSNNRVLVFDTLPTGDGASADLVLGQGSFTTCTPNDDNQDGGSDPTPTDRTMNYPTDVWSDGTRLVVADADNNRVLIWTTFPTTDFQPADVVLGQSDMVSNAVGTGAGGLNFPYFVASNGNQLFVADAANNRVLIFEGMPTANGALADGVLGQGDFAHVASNDDNQDGASDGGPSARTLDYPAGLLVLDGSLVVTDNGNSRLIVMRP